MDIAPTLPAAWRARDVAGKEAFCVDLEASDVAALESAAEAFRRGGADRPVHASDFPLPALADPLEQVSHTLDHGGGLVVLRGFPVDRLDVDTLGLMFRGLGAHLGREVSQSVVGERLGHVTDAAAGEEKVRGYRNRIPLELHSDICDRVGFLCVRAARSGGVSRFASALAVHDALEAARPDCLRTLRRGFPYHRFGEQAPGEAPVTPYRVPVFSRCDGVTSCRYIPNYIREAACEPGHALTAEEIEALEVFDAVAHRDDMMTEFPLAPGEAALFNNWTVLHGRSAFEDGESAKRLLLRLWLATPGHRPLVPEVQLYDGAAEGGVPPQPGRTVDYRKRAGPAFGGER